MPIATIDVPSTVLAHTSPIIQNKPSSPASLPGGVLGNLIASGIYLWLTNVVSCTAPSGNLDDLGAFLRTREHAELLFRLLKPDDLWTRYGIIPDMKVR